MLGFPIWWALGLSEFILIFAAIPMGWELIRRRGVRAPRGFGIWLLFLLVFLASGFGLTLDAPFASGAGSPISYAFSLSWCVAAAIVLLYIGNLSEAELPTERVSRLLAWIFVFASIGAMVGLLAPTFNFTSFAEIVLPRGLTSNDFFVRLTHPAVADIQSVLGFEQARPRAPFAYANGWGANLSLTLPFFLNSWCRRNSGWRRYLAPVILIAAATGTVYSLNRGLWGVLVFGAVFAGVQYVRRVGSRAIPAVVGAVLVAAAIASVSPLSAIVGERLDNPHSNEVRGNLAGTSVESMLKGSPFIGFGASRAVEGSFSSIALGPTADCPRCGLTPPLGTQGQVWAVLFDHGLLGALLFFAFFFVVLRQYVRSKEPIAVIGVAVILFAMFESLVYDIGSHSLFFIFMAIALMWRTSRARAMLPDETAQNQSRA